LSSLSSAAIFQPNAFGGDGSGNGSRRFITDGPFANTTLHLNNLGEAPGDYRIYRDFDVSTLAGAAQASLDTCFQINNYTSVWACWADSPHLGGHFATGGLMSDTVLSPGDPVFFLHVSFIVSALVLVPALDMLICFIFSMAG
jgi:tyrosinase